MSKVQIHKQQTHACTLAHTQTPTHMHTNTHLDTHRHLRAGGLKKKFSERERFSKKIEGTDRGCVTNRSGEFVPCCWSLVRERVLTTWLCANGWYSEHSGVCRRMELARRSVKVKKIWEVGGGRTIQRFKAKWSEFEFKSFFSIGSQCRLWRRGVTWLNLEC